MDTNRPVFTVTQLNHQVRLMLEQNLTAISVEGEVSTVSKPVSGHVYFTLKDTTAQLRCVYFRNRHNITEPHTALQQGNFITAHGTLSLYEPRGDYQLIVAHIQEAGIGALYRQFEQLKEKLATMGLFENNRKKPIPRCPNTIGIITSTTGAALHDMLTTLARRYPIAKIRIYPSDVQGKKAAPQLIRAIQQANTERCSDVLILARGGGSLEDLWAFNDEKLAYAIALSTIPIITGVGHETDITIADFVADLRAATPTGAAEAAAPNKVDLIALIQTWHASLIYTINRLIQHKHLLLTHAYQTITSPTQLIRSKWQTLDYLTSHISHASTQLISHKQQSLALTIIKLRANTPMLHIQNMQVKLERLSAQLKQYITLLLTTLQHNLTTYLSTLHAVSPLATIGRGYAIITHNNHVLLDSTTVKIHDQITVQLAKGRLLCEVIATQQTPSR